VVTDVEERTDELARYLASMRRQRRWYVAVVAAVAVVAVGVTLVVWFTGEITHVHLHTAKTAPPNVPLGTPPAAPAAKWRSPDATAIGAPFSGGTVVTYSAHTVTGREAVTGRAYWTYTRTDRTVCEVAQIQGHAIAVFEDSGACNEVTTLDTGTGQREWTRTLDENALTVTGRPVFIATSDTLLVWTPDFVYSIDPSSGYDRWTFPAGDGCALTSVVPGSAGVLMSERCGGDSQLLLRDRTAGSDDKQQSEDKKNQVQWRLKHTSTVPVAADSVVAALDPSTRQLVIYGPDKGAVRSRVSLQPAPSATTPISQAAANDGELIWIAGTGYALEDTGAQRWSAALTGMPTLTAPDGSAIVPELSSARLLVPTSDGVAALDGLTGKVTTRYPVPAPAPGSQVFPVGNGLLVAGPSTTYYA
jgi:outer membrane protein assembly factor BamB